MISKRSAFRLLTGIGAVAVGAFAAIEFPDEALLLQQNLSPWIKPSFIFNWFGDAAHSVSATEDEDRLGAAPSPTEAEDQAPPRTNKPQPELLDARSLAETGAALGLDLTGLREAIGFYKAGDLNHGDSAAKTAKDNIVQIALEWIALRNFPREAGFERLQAFAKAHPAWPAQQWLRKRSEEALFGDHKNLGLVKAFFSGSSPETPAGKLALVRVLEEEGRPAEAAALVHSVWRDSDLIPALETRIRLDFGSYLSKADHKYRAEHFLYKEQVAPALRAAALAGPEVMALTKLRIAVIDDTANDKLFNKVPAPLQTDPSFLFAKIQKLRRSDKIREATDIMLKAPRDPVLLVNGDEWWVERRLIARKLLDQGDAATAYKICAEHSATSHEMKLEAEFHAGWIALRFLNDPARASVHFANLAALAETPMSVARAAYWQGRAAEATFDDDAMTRAAAFYEKAAAQPATYYGQLARGRLGLQTLPVRTIENESTGEAREDSVRVIELLYAIGEKELALPLVTEAAKYLAHPSQVAALASIVAKDRDAHVSLLVGKLVNQRGMAIDTLAFPTYGVPLFQPLQNSAAQSIVYSICRQESAFDPKAVSSAGAKGLMQMIVSTARRTAERAGIAFDENRLLSDASFNAQLAAAHLGDLLAEQRGSYILAFAAYNAGGKRVKQWIDSYGDPRTPGVDPIDWVERIPITETRNYVQRVIENLAMYQVRFGEPQTALGEGLYTAQAKL